MKHYTFTRPGEQDLWAGYEAWLDRQIAGDTKSDN